MLTQFIKLNEISKGMNPVEQKNIACKCRTASQKYSEIAALLDEAGVALENDKFETCIAKLKKVKAILE